MAFIFYFIELKLNFFFFFLNYEKKTLFQGLPNLGILFYLGKITLWYIFSIMRWKF